ncbi:MAG TPA: hydroxysqualene dehydroxylase HpnE [Methylomirabilota bacterium]|nr:hydroxysqualene dehydroxylase HpnE [Methylomirabilota bacterium]
MSSKSVIVIGGGLAGLSSAVALADAGYRVRLFEKRPHLGGRAASYDLPGGEHVDNCQHVTMGCCTNLDDFYSRVGAAGKIRMYGRLTFADPDGRRGTIESSPLPPPLHLAPSFAAFPLLDVFDKGAIARALLTIARKGGCLADAVNGSTMLDWLRRHGQTPRAISHFWGVVLVSALDEELDRMGAQYGIEVFWKAFLANAAGYRIGIPGVPLGELYGGCRSAIEKRGGEVRLRAGVRGIVAEDGRAAGVEFTDGVREVGDFYLAAVPHDILPTFIPQAMREREPAFANVERLRSAPITGVHLWLDREVMSEPFLAVLDRTTQWIFNKTLLSGARPEIGQQYVQLVISASYGLVSKSRQEILALCLGELREFLPAARGANLMKGTVIKETGATFSPEPGCDRWRPSQATSISNLFLAGDWTSTGWPATMEGAVRSGYLAAEAICAADGAPRRFLKPELRSEGLSRWWAG